MRTMFRLQAFVLQRVLVLLLSGPRGTGWGWLNRVITLINHVTV